MTCAAGVPLSLQLLAGMGVALRTFLFQLEDEQRPFPAIIYVALNTESRARAKAAEFLLLARNHRSIHVFHEKRLLFTLSRDRRRGYVEPSLAFL